MNQTAGKIDGSGMDAFSRSVTTTSGINIPGGGAVDASYVFDLWARFQQGRVAPDELPAVRNALAVAEANARLGGPGSVSFEGKADDQMWIGRLKQIVAALDTSTQMAPTGIRKPTTASANGGSSVTTSPVTPAASSPAVAQSGAASSTPVNIFIGGQARATVNVASGDVGALRSVLAELAQASERASW